MLCGCRSSRSSRNPVQLLSRGGARSRYPDTSKGGGGGVNGNPGSFYGGSQFYGVPDTAGIHFCLETLLSPLATTQRCNCDQNYGQNSGSILKKGINGLANYIVCANSVYCCHDRFQCECRTYFAMRSYLL